MSRLFILDVYNFINAQRFEDGCVPEEKINTEQLLEDIKSVIITQESIIGSRDKCIEEEIRKNNELQKHLNQSRQVSERFIAENNTTMPSQSSLYREVKKLKQENEKLTKNKYDKFKCEKCKGHCTGCANPTCDTCVEELKEENEKLKQELKRSHELNAAQPLVKRIEELKQENEELKQGIKDLFLKFD